MPVLLVSLGASWPVVPEAFHALPPGPDGFSAVHVLTTASAKIDAGIAQLRGWFAARHPAVELTITRVAGFEDLKSEGDHFAFEEVLYRWMLEAAPRGTSASGLRAPPPYVCLAGGFKTMSAAMQKAAAVLGAAEVFHVLAQPLYPGEKPGSRREARASDEVDDSLARGAVSFIRLGPESGWPQLRAASALDYPLKVVSIATDGTRLARAPDTRIRDRLRDIVERSHRIAENWSELTELPFPELATRPGAELAWLRQPLDPSSAIDRGWIAALPKVELHCHLGGFATHGGDLATVRASADRPEALPALRECAPPAGWPLPEQPIALDAYMRLGDNNGRKLLRDPGCLRAQCEALYAHLLQQGVVYAEIRCSPNNYADPARGRSAQRVLADIRGHFQSAMEAARKDHAEDSRRPFPCHVNLLVIATRKDTGDRSDISRHLALAITAADEWRASDSCRVVGVDLAGFEHRDTRAALFATDFEPVHRVGLAVTVHAGENDDAEGIWQAVFRLNARRLGHALHLADSPDLLRAVADRGIGIEMCPYANAQIKGFTPFAGSSIPYPLLNYMRAGVRVTANTDNTGISAASLADNLLLAARLCPGITRLEVLRLQRNALEAAFVSPDARRALVAAVASRLPQR